MKISAFSNLQHPFSLLKHSAIFTKTAPAMQKMHASSNLTPQPVTNAPQQQFKSFAIKAPALLNRQAAANHDNLGILQNRHIIETKPLVVLIASDKHNHIMVLNTERSMALGLNVDDAPETSETKKKLLELPHFELNPNDDPRKKIHEELAKLALNTRNAVIHPVNDYFTMPHFSSQRFFVYLVQNCEVDMDLVEKDKPFLHPTSSVYVEWLPPRKIKELIEYGHIHDAKTCIALAQVILHFYFTSNTGWFSISKLFPFGLGLLAGGFLLYFVSVATKTKAVAGGNEEFARREYENSIKSQIRKSTQL